ncbi:MAG TPA: ABC transporter permease subunit [Albitalea sp.]|uniref:ABC transporter permease n=1 Tax=Piscinibacter sp. TaxID=1903157 RepID=UPI002ED64B8D
MTSAERRRRFEPEDRIWVAVGLFTALTLALAVPLVVLLLWSFADRWAAPNLLPQAYSGDTWRAVLRDSTLLAAAVNSTMIALAVTLLTALVAMPTAWAMAKLPLRCRRAVEIFVLAPVIVPGVVVATGVGQVFLMLGIAYTVTGVVLVQMVGTLPLMVRLLAASFEVLPDELLHAARSLGAGPLQVAWHVVLPLSVPGLLAGALLSFVGSFEEFDKTFIVGAPVVQTLPVLLYHHLDPYSLQFPLAAAVALILLLPVLVVFVLSGRILRDDVMAAGMGKV